MAFALTACGRPAGGRAGAGTRDAGPPREGWPLGPGSSLILVVNGDGNLEPAPVAADGTPAIGRPGQPLPFPLALAAAALQPLPGGAVVAINRTGLRWLRVIRYPAEPGGQEETRIALSPIVGADAEFKGRSLAPSWSWSGKAHFLLYRHPIFELEAARTPSSVLITASQDGAALAGTDIGAEAYALFPLSADYWLVQYRTESKDRVTTAYRRFFPADGSSEPLGRAQFEKLASPEPLSAAPEALQAAAASLSGPLIVEARLPDGSRRAYQRGDPGQAAPAWAHVSDSGERAALVVTDDWRIAVARPDLTGFRTATAYPSSPLPGARVRDAALVDGLVVALWEEDLFPEIGASGLFVLASGL